MVRKITRPIITHHSKRRDLSIKTENQTTLSDEWLMQQLANGDLRQAAFLFDRYQLKLYNFFLRMTFREQLSEDLTQSTFERMIRYRSSYNPQQSFKTWIYKIARNVRNDQFRQGKIPSQTIEQIQELPEPEANPVQQLDRKEQLQLLEKAMAYLPEQDRELLVLTRIQKWRYQEVAELWGITEGNVKVKVFRALQQLRNIYSKLER